MLRARADVLYSPIIHGSLRPPVGTDLEISNMETPARMTFLLAEMGLEMGNIHL